MGGLDRKAEMLPVKIRVEDITAETREKAFSEPEGEINRLLEQGRVREYALEEPVTVSISYYRAGMELFFEGNLSANISATCARCAEEFNVFNERQFRFVLAPKASGLMESGADSDDLDFSVYEGEEIDLSPFVREQVLLALPTRPLCNEECRGLCSNCGANLNLGACGCQGETRISGFAILRTLKISRS